MRDRQVVSRTDYVRPLAVAAVFTVAGEAMVFIVWELVHYPGGDVTAKLLWVTLAAMVLAAAIGFMVGFIVGGRYHGTVAAVVSSFCYATVLIAGILISYEIDMAKNLFGVRRDPELFVLTGILPAILTAPLYGWLLHSNLGKALLSRIGL